MSNMSAPVRVSGACWAINVMGACLVCVGSVLNVSMWVQVAASQMSRVETLMSFCLKNLETSFGALVPRPAGNGWPSGINYGGRRVRLILIFLLGGLGACSDIEEERLPAPSLRPPGLNSTALPIRAVAMARLGVALAERGSPMRALSSLRGACGLGVRVADLLACPVLARIHLDTHQPQAAADAIRHVPQVGVPTEVQQRVQMVNARLLMTEDELGQAEQIWLNLLAQADGVPTESEVIAAAWAGMSKVARSEGRSGVPELVRALTAVSRSGSKGLHHQITSELSMALADEGRHSQAEQIAQAVITDGGGPVARVALAYVLIARGRPTSALLLLDGVEDDDAEVLKAVACAQSGRMADAVRIWLTRAGKPVPDHLKAVRPAMVARLGG